MIPGGRNWKSLLLSVGLSVVTGTHIAQTGLELAMQPKMILNP